MAKFNQQLLVEGNDDLHVILALCQKFNIDQNFEIIDCKGIDNLTAQIPVRLKQSGIKTVAIIVDADTEIKNRYASLSTLFSKQGILIPYEIPIEGLIVNTESIRIGIWMMPNNNLNGMLEDFISFLMPKQDKLVLLANQTLANIENQKLNKYILAHKAKALIHSWLSWQEDPGTPMGLAITKKFLITEGENCDKLISWLTNVFK